MTDQALDTYMKTHDDLIAAALQMLLAERTAHGTQYELIRAYAEDTLAAVARRHVRAVDDLPEDQQPPGWNETDIPPPTRILPVTPDEQGIARVVHGLGTMKVRIQCRNGSGELIGYKHHVPITENEVEVAAVPGTDLTAVMVTADPVQE